MSDRLSRSHAELARSYDAIVVGSGYGGGVAACRLARAGLRVCVLERGREFLAGEFPTRLREMMRQTRYEGDWWQPGLPLALFDFRPGEELHVLLACGLGGGSLINAAVALRPDLPTLRARGWPADVLDDPGFDDDFARAEAMLGVTLPPSDTRAGARHRALQRAAALIGAAAEPLPIAIGFVPRLNGSGVIQYACRRCGDCWSGCNAGAKNTVAVTYLADAAAHGAAIFERCRVSHIERGKGADWLVFMSRHDEDGNKPRGGECAIAAPLLVLAAGSLGSTEILLRSKARGLALSERLGEGFSANGDDLAFLAGLDEPIGAVAIGYPTNVDGVAPPGPNCSAQIRIRTADGTTQMLLQDGTMSRAMASLAPLDALKRLRLLRFARMLHDGKHSGRRARTATFYIVGHDRSDGRVVLEADRAIVSWPDIAADPCYAAARGALEKIAEGLGATLAANPFSSPLLGGKKVTVHPLGGCGMGRDAANGVVDARCRVFDPSAEHEQAVHAGLLVCDGAVMPGSVGVNPLLTITAVAERAIRLLVAEKGLQRRDDKPMDARVRDSHV